MDHVSTLSFLSFLRIRKGGAPFPKRSDIAVGGAA